MTVMQTCRAVVTAAFVLGAVPAWAQAVAHPEQARPVQGDPGISSSQVLDQPQYRILRDYAEPGATRRNHNHPDATFHVFVLITGKLRLTVEGQPPVEVHYTLENTGLITDLWILRDEEKASKPWPTKPEHTITWSFDPGTQTWTKP